MQTPALGINYVYRIRASLYPVLISVITSFCERLTEHNTQMKGTNSAKCTIYVSSEMWLCSCLRVKWQQTMETKKNELTKGNNCIHLNSDRSVKSSSFGRQLCINGSKPIIWLNARTCKIATEWKSFVCIMLCEISITSDSAALIRNLIFGILMYFKF